MGCKNCQDTKNEVDIMKELDQEIIEEKEEKKIFKKKEKVCKCGHNRSHRGICDRCGEKI
jgi:hypothetical protein